ncbi:hypothetical protein NDU88_004896 [Pleurodeles waltl]|uniref:Uncharacterized protein n=1 Tax=Pleurodeles waltl TaxID=8319 RepID=A0AAV7V2B4_PLEWA|nr:hypothetical protein NDU88_004896 [Pleurodeles waltl]
MLGTESTKRVCPTGLGHKDSNTPGHFEIPVMPNTPRTRQDPLAVSDGPVMIRLKPGTNNLHMTGYRLILPKSEAEGKGQDSAGQRHTGYSKSTLEKVCGNTTERETRRETLRMRDPVMHGRTRSLRHHPATNKEDGLRKSPSNKDRGRTADLDSPIIKHF